MKKIILKLGALYLAVFLIYYTLVAYLGMVINDQDFFWITPTKLLVRLILPAFVVTQLYFNNTRIKKWINE